jgi:hypothetical protein
VIKKINRKSLLILLTAVFASCSQDELNEVSKTAESSSIQNLQSVSQAPSKWNGSFGYNAGSWRVEKHPRVLADVNGDGREDVVGFANDGVYVALSTGTGFSYRQPWYNTPQKTFCYNGGWDVNKHPRAVADVNGDGKADIVGFGNDGVYVALSTGSGFSYRQPWYTSPQSTFCYNGGWDVNKHPRTVADVNGDGKADIVGFGDDGVYVALSTGTGFSFRQPWYTSPQSTFCYNGGWSVDKHPRTVADVNGDGKADIVGFGNDGVYVALSTGSGFSYRQAWYTSPQSTFCYNGGWYVSKHPRTVADVNADGKADIIGFGNDGVFVALSNGNGFDYRTQTSTYFGYNDGWDVAFQPRRAGDVNGDGKADIVGFDLDGVYVQL